MERKTTGDGHRHWGMEIDKRREQRSFESVQTTVTEGEEIGNGNRHGLSGYIPGCECNVLLTSLLN